MTEREKLIQTRDSVLIRLRKQLQMAMKYYNQAIDTLEEKENK